MSRDLSAGMISAVTADTVRPIMFMQFEFDGGTLRFWTGIGTISWNSVTWTGSGNVIGISAIKEVADNSAQGAQFSLNGIPSALISTALTENYQGRTAKMWLGAMDSSAAIIADPYLLFSGRMDTMSISDGGETASITLSVENKLIDLGRSRERRYTPEDQAIDYPTDTGFRYIAGLQDKQIVWGAGSSTVAGGGEARDSGDGEGPIP